MLGFLLASVSSMAENPLYALETDRHSRAWVPLSTALLAIAVFCLALNPIGWVVALVLLPPALPVAAATIAALHVQECRRSGLWMDACLSLLRAERIMAAEAGPALRFALAPAAALAVVSCFQLATFAGGRDLGGPVGILLCTGGALLLGGWMLVSGTLIGVECGRRCGSLPNAATAAGGLAFCLVLLTAFGAVRCSMMLPRDVLERSIFPSADCAWLAAVWSLIGLPHLVLACLLWSHTTHRMRVEPGA